MISAMKGGHDEAVLRFRPSDVPLQHVRENPQDLAVHVVDRGREEKQAADHPAIAGFRSICSRLAGLGFCE